MLRVMLETNVLSAAAYTEGSASARIVEACLDGRLEPVINPQLRAEYEWILPKAIRVPHWRERYGRLLGRAILAELTRLSRVVVDNPSDDILVATALAGPARAIITDDRHLLELGLHQRVWIARPRQFVAVCRS